MIFTVIFAILLAHPAQAQILINARLARQDFFMNQRLILVFPLADLANMMTQELTLV